MGESMSFAVQYIMNCPECKNILVLVSNELLQPKVLLKAVKNRGWHGRIEGMVIVAHCPECRDKVIGMGKAKIEISTKLRNKMSTKLPKHGKMG